MNCRYCGTALPDGALFCGECGQPVTAAHSDAAATGSSVIVPAARSARGSGSASGITVVDSEESAPATIGFSIADLAFSSPGETSEPEDDDRELPDGAPPDGADSADSSARCPQCGEAMAHGDVFCGECGFVVRTVSPPAGDGSASDPAPFVVVPELIDLGEFSADPEVPEPEVRGPEMPEPEAVDEARDADATTEVEPLDLEAEYEPDADANADDDDDAADADDAAGVDDLVLESAPGFAQPQPEGDPDLEFDDPLPFSEPQRANAEAKRRTSQSPRSRPIPDPFPWGTEQPVREDLEATRLVADPAAGTRYVLQFSTGESVTVAGSGLVGRNPSMQPGEYVDQLVPIFDAGKSVSKTHLEFGQESGRFWVSDRYSTNGSVIRQPDAEPRRCDAGRRYFIARGTRVDVGEQFFVVS
jgi:uncharacterized Zn finger protein (UPF0148 family)